MSTSRPKRSTRATTRADEKPTKRISILAEHLSDINAKRKRVGESDEEDEEEDEWDDFVEKLLVNPSSQLTKIDMKKLINEDTWYSLSVESRRRLCELLPRSTFRAVEVEVDWSHPSRLHTDADRKETFKNEGLCFGDGEQELPIASHFITDEELACGPPPSFTLDPSFQSASSTFQDHIVSGWMKPAHSRKLTNFRQSVIEGSSHVPWKDDSWENEIPRPVKLKSELDLFELIREHRLIQELDIFQYSVQLRKGLNSKATTFTSDMLLYSIVTSKRGGEFTFILPPKPPHQSVHAILPSSIVLPAKSSGGSVEIPEMEPPVYQTTISDVSNLEDVIIDRTLNWNPGFELASTTAGLKRWTVNRWNSSFERDILPILQSESDDIPLDDYITNLGTMGGRTRVASLYYLAHLAAP